MDNTAMVFFNHRYGTVQQVAKVIGQVSVYALYEARQGEVTVAAEVNFAEQVVTQGVRAVHINQRNRVDNVAQGFTHLGAVYD